MKKEKFVRVLTCKVAETPKVEIIENTLANLQKFVGGYIEVSYAVEGTTMIINEEGKMQNLKPNFLIRSFDVIVGDVLFIGSRDEDFASISLLPYCTCFVSTLQDFFYKYFARKLL